MKILIVGAGYVGLIAAVVLSTKHNVTIVEINSERIELINRGTPPIYEAGLDEMLKTAIRTKSLRAITPNSECESHDIAILCVGTPALENGSVDIQYVESAVSFIKEHLSHLLNNYLVVALRSTVPPGTTRRLLLDPLKGIKDASRVGVVYHPEFLRQGQALQDIRNPDRLVLGVSDTAARKYREMLMSCIPSDEIPVLEMSLESAELCKYVSNSFLATKVSFSNEISALAERIPHTDIDDVLSGLVADHRIHPSHLGAGLGFGGSCLPKDLVGLLNFSELIDQPMPLLKAVHQVNENTSNRIMKILYDILHNIEGKKIAILGIAFKANNG